METIKIKEFIIMTIEKKINGEAATLVIAGRLDTQTAPELEKEILSNDIKHFIRENKINIICFCNFRKSGNNVYSFRNNCVV